MTTLLNDICKSTMFRPIEQIRKEKIMQTIKSPKFIEVQAKITNYINKKTIKQVNFNFKNNRYIDPQPQYGTIMNNDRWFSNFCNKLIKREIHELENNEDLEQQEQQKKEKNDDN